MDVFLTLFVAFTIIVAFCQDLKRREVDNWLNLFLIIGSAVYIFYCGMFGEYEVIFNFALVLAVMFLLMNLFYYGRVFGGGDAGLLFAMSGFFVGINFFESLANIGIFVVSLMISGSIYGLFYSGVLYVKNFKKVNKSMKVKFNEIKYFVGIISLLGVVFLAGGLIHVAFSILGGVIIIFPFLFIFAKSLENVSMIREISGKDLREGDWLVNDEKAGSTIVHSKWEGLSEKEVKILRGKKKIKIKDGLPFVPAFLIAFIFYIFCRELINRVLF